MSDTPISWNSTSTYQRFKGHAYGYDAVDLGFNYRLDEIRAALGIVQLNKLSNYNIEREKRFFVTDLSWPNASKLRFLSNHPYESSYHIFPILIPGDGERRNCY